MKEMTGALLTRDGQVLLGMRAAHKSFAGCWDIVGGHIEARESPWSALRRELAEELGIAVVTGDHLETMDLADATGRTSRLHIHLVHEWEGEAALANDEHAELRWFRFEAAQQLPNLATADYRRLFALLESRSSDRAG